MSKQTKIHGFGEADVADIENQTFGYVISDALPAYSEKIPIGVQEALSALQGNSNAWDLLFSDKRCTKGFFLLIKNFNLGESGDIRNVYATIKYLEDQPGEHEKRAVELLKDYMEKREVLPMGIVEEIRPLLPQVVYNDLISVAREEEPEIEAPAPIEEVKPAEVTNEVITKLRQEQEDLRELISMEDDTEVIAKLEQEIKDLQEIIELEQS